MVLAITRRNASKNHSAENPSSEKKGLPQHNPLKKRPVNQTATSKLQHFMSTFSDFIVLGLLVVTVFVVRDFSHDARMNFIDEPQINDFYFVDFHLLDQGSDRQFRYLPLKVAYVGEQCIHFFPAKNGHNEPVGINTHVKLDATMRPGFFHKNTLSFSRSEVKEWTQQGILYDIGRPSSYYINGWIVIGAADIIRVDDAKRGKYVKADTCLDNTAESQQPGSKV